MSCLQEQNVPNKKTITISRTITKIVQPSFRKERGIFYACFANSLDKNAFTVYNIDIQF